MIFPGTSLIFSLISNQPDLWSPFCFVNSRDISSTLNQLSGNRYNFTFILSNSDKPWIPGNLALNCSLTNQFNYSANFLFLAIPNSVRAIVPKNFQVLMKEESKFTLDDSNGNIKMKKEIVIQNVGQVEMDAFSFSAQFDHQIQQQQQGQPVCQKLGDRFLHCSSASLAPGQNRTVLVEK